MTRIAILADIHGNVPALEAVVDDITSADVDEVLVGGDLVGRGPQGSAVIARVRALGWPCVQGNHEDYLLSFRAGTVPEAWRTSDDWSCARWMAAELSADDEAYIAGLPFSMTATRGPEVRIVHGSPTSFQEGIGPWTSDTTLRRHLAQIDEPVLVCAHTHRPLIRQVDGRLVVNTGSVGLPFDGDWHARYAILERSNGRWSVEHRRVPWDRDRLLALYRSTGFLTGGGVTASLLEMEVLTARSHLVPFIEWSRHVGRDSDRRALAVFRERFDPSVPFDDWLASQNGAVRSATPQPNPASTA